MYTHLDRRLNPVRIPSSVQAFLSHKLLLTNHHAVHHPLHIYAVACWRNWYSLAVRSLVRRALE